MTTLAIVASVLLAAGIVVARQIPPRIPRVPWYGHGPIYVLVSPDLPAMHYASIAAAVREAIALGHTRVRPAERANADRLEGCVVFRIPAQDFRAGDELGRTRRIDRDALAHSAVIELPTDLRGRTLDRVASHELFHALGYAHCGRPGHRMHPDAAKMGDDLAGLSQ